MIVKIILEATPDSSGVGNIWQVRFACGLLGNLVAAPLAQAAALRNVTIALVLVAHRLTKPSKRPFLLVTVNV
jgi:hypothetical protein